MSRHTHCFLSLSLSLSFFQGSSHQIRGTCYMTVKYFLAKNKIRYVAWKSCRKTETMSGRYTRGTDASFIFANSDVLKKTNKQPAYA